MKLIATPRVHHIYGEYTAYLLVLDDGRQVMIHEDYRNEGTPEMVDVRKLDPKRFD